MTSYDVKPLFTSVPTKDQHVHTTNNHTPGVLPQKHMLLFQGKYFEQVHGVAMGPPISPLITNLFMAEFKLKALSSTPYLPHLWLGYIDDTFVIQEAKHSQQLLQHINSQDQHIQFTVEEPNQEGALPFLDTFHFSRTQQHYSHHSLQKAYTY